MTAANILGALVLALLLSSSHLLGPDDIEADRDTAATVQALGQP